MGREGDRFGKQRLRFESREEKRDDHRTQLLDMSYHSSWRADDDTYLGRHYKVGTFAATVPRRHRRLRTLLACLYTNAAK